MNFDPTREEMLAVLAAMPFANECEDFDREEAIYWFANDWHGGQDSNLYSVLSTSEYDPGPLSTGCDEESMSALCYEELEHAFTETEDQRKMEA